MHPILARTLGAALLCTAAPAQFLYGVDTSRNVYEFDHVTGAAALVGSLPGVVSTPRELAWDTDNERLFVLGHSSPGAPTFCTVDTTTWSVVFNGTLPAAASTHESLEWHAGVEVCFMLTSGGDLSKINPVSGQTSFVGNTGIGSLQSLGYDPTTNKMYVCGGIPATLYELDVNTAATTTIALLSGASNCASMTYDSDLQRMLMTDSPGSKIRVLDLTTGVATQLSTANTPQLRALAFVPGSGTLEHGAIGCGPVLTTTLGSPNIGGGVTFRMQNATGIPVVGYGLADVIVPFCGCMVGHDWLSAVVGAQDTFQIPNNPAYVGAEVLIQGLDFLGGGGCASPQLALTDRVKITVGS